MIKNVKIGINLLWIGFFGGLIIQNLYFWSLSSEGVLFDPFIFILSCLFVLPINIYELWLILKIRRGRNWARWTFLITHIISYLISIFTGLFDGPKTNFYFEEIHFAASLCSMSFCSFTQLLWWRICFLRAS